METCLALTIFRDEFNMSFVGMFTLLTFVKVFHWLVQDRVDYIEVTPTVSRLQHLRIVSFMVVLMVSIQGTSCSFVYIPNVAGPN
jgi:E3 ubiquitin-protein ligase synoviolin